MRRVLMSLTLLLAWPAAADAARVKVVDCVPALDPVARSATFEARVRAARGSDRMQVRFALQVRDEGFGSRWRKVTAAGFDEWLTSAAGVRKYIYARTIQNLAAPAAYRTIVRFRWLDADGVVLKSARATSAACRQPDMRPDLEPVRVAVAPGPDFASRRYTVTLRNAGRTDAGPFDVALDAAAEPVGGLAAGARQSVVVVAPACAPDAPPPTLTLDPADAVDERDEDDNVLAITCP